MAARKINYHPDSIDSEGRSFVLIGLTIVSGLAAILFIFFLLDLGPPGTLELLYIAGAASVPIGLAALAFRGDKESYAYDRYSQIVNYSEPVKMRVEEIKPVLEKVKINTSNGDIVDVDEQRYEVHMSRDGKSYRCIVKRRVYLPELSKEKESDTVEVYIDLTSDEVAAFKLSESLYWAIPNLVLSISKKSHKNKG